MNYRLKKDLPDLKEGKIFKREPDSQYYSVPGGCERGSVWHKDAVENNSEWFEPVPERIKLTVQLDQIENPEFKLIQIPREYANPKNYELMEQAINGETFTKEDMIDFAPHYMAQRIFIGNVADVTKGHDERDIEIFDRWLKDKQSKS